MASITKCIIPAAGFGTRFLPATKAIPKEMFPIVDKPVIQYVVEEAVASGIEDVIFVTNSAKRSIEDHFDLPTQDLIQNLVAGGKQVQLEILEKIASMAQFISVRQKGPYGNGVPVLSAEKIIGNEPFAVLWGDEFIASDRVPRLKQMIDVYEKYPGVIISGVRIRNKKDLSRYGIADVTPIDEKLFRINTIVEKPDPDAAPSNLATHGAYILPPEIFDALRNIQPGKGGEIWLVDAINLLRDRGIPVYALEIEDAVYYDTGNKLEYMKTCVDFALKHPEIGTEFREWLRTELLNQK